MSEWQRFRDRMLDENPILRREYERIGPLYDAIGASNRRRYDLGLTQADLAKRMGKHQSAIARFENGNSPNPSLNFLIELAEALDMRLSFRFEPKDEAAEKKSAPSKRAASATKKAEPASASRTKRAATAASR